MQNKPNINCKNCGENLVGSYCHTCGQKLISEKWTTNLLVKQFIHQISNIEKGFWHTVKGLFVFPGKLLHDYWRGKTIVYYNPFRYVLIWTAVNLLINFWLGIDDLLQEQIQPQLIEDSFSKSEIQSADKKFDSWLNILVILQVPINSFITKWLFKKSGQNYAEHLILNTYLLAQQSLMGSFTQFVFYFFQSTVYIYFLFNFMVGLVYNTYVFKRTFKEKWILIIGKALLLCMIGMLIFILLIALFSTVAFMSG